MIVRDKDVFLELVPPPRFLQMPAVGLDITDRRARFIEFKKGSGGLVIKRRGEIKIPPGVVVSGKLKRPEELKKVFSDFARENDFSFARVSLPEERAYIVKMNVPDVSYEEMRNAIAFQLDEYVPVSAKEAVFDYQIIGPSAEKKGSLEVSVSVLPHKEIDAYLHMLSGTGIMPVAFEIEAQAIARAVIPKEKSGTYAIADIGGSRTGLFVISGKAARFTSTIDAGSNMVTEALEKQFGVGRAEAEKMKNERPLVRGSDDFSAAVLPSLSILRDEINKLFVYWHTHRQEGKNLRIEKVYLSGGGANLKGLDEYLSASLRVPVEVSNPWVNVNDFDRYIPDIPHRLSLGYAAAIGLALAPWISCKEGYCI